MRLTVLGATGGIGSLLLQQSLEQGHQVTAFVRSPKKIAIQSPRLHVVGGDLYNAQQMAEAIRGSDVVLSAFGPTVLRRSHLRRDFARVLVHAMRAAGVRRFLHVSSAFCFREGGLLYALMTSTLFRNVTNDHCDADEELTQSDLEWTVLRPPRLTDGPARGNLNVVGGHLARGLTITRADVANFMLTEAAAPHHVRQLVGLSN